MRTVLVTGGARRIGAAVCRELAAAGWRVLIHANHSHAEARSLASELGGRVIAPVDFAEADSADRCFEAALDAADGTLDALVNNASIFGRSPLLDAGTEEFNRFWRVNTLAPITLTRRLAGHLRERGARGAVVQLLDQRIARPGNGDVPYALSKQALAAFTRAAAVELAPTLRVNGVAPGAVLPPEGVHEVAGAWPLGARATAAQVASSVRFPLEAESVTGQILFADGGQHLLESTL